MPLRGDYEVITSRFRVRWGRLNNADDESPRAWELNVSDRVSGIEVLTLRMSDSEMARLMSGQMVSDIGGELVRSPLHGQEQEVRQIQVPLLREDTTMAEAVARAQDQVKGWDGGGWVVDPEETFNHHRVSGSRIDGTAKYTMTVRRWKEPTG